MIISANNDLPEPLSPVTVHTSPVYISQSIGTTKGLSTIRGITFESERKEFMGVIVKCKDKRSYDKDKTKNSGSIEELHA